MNSIQHYIHSTMEKPQFLKEADIIDLKKDTCIFCNGLFKTDCICSSGTAESRGDHGFGSCEYHWTNERYSPRELELNIFSVSFIPEERGEVYGTKKYIYEKLTKEIKDRAEQLREDLKTKIDLPEGQKQSAIDAIVNDCIAELEYEPRGFFHGSNTTRLDQRLEAYYHNLFLEDLDLIAKAGEDYAKPGSWDDTISYCNGLKAHTKCWPYKAVADPEDRAVPYRKFIENLQGNPRFAGYQAKLEEFPEVFDATKKLSLILKVHKFDPFMRQ